MPDFVWSTAAHDVVPPLEVGATLGEVPTYLHALLRSEHEEFREPYSKVREQIEAVLEENAVRTRGAAQAPRSDIAGSRLRTWKKVFEEFGLLYVSDGDQRLRTTALGRLVRDVHEDLSRKIEGANEHLVALGLAVLSRHTLASPLVTAEYPPGTDLHPYRAIWAAARALDDRIHWEEMNRVLMHLLKDEDVPAAIEHIRTVRPVDGSDYTEALLAALGAPAVDDGLETRRRITPWLAKAGFGGTFLGEGQSGFWQLAPSYLPLLEAVLDEPPTRPDHDSLATREAYLAYLIDGLAVTSLVPGPSDIAMLDRLEDAARRYGSRKIIALSGIPGTGKTRIARLLAARLTDNDAFRMEEIQFHEATGYEQFIEGFVPRPHGDGFELRPMTLREINQRATNDPAGRTHVLLIEEFTRADVHSVLGEVLTYVEHRDRSFRLALSQTEFKLAPNLIIIATMNPRDKSAINLDHAILRRLHQVAIDPDPDVLRTLAVANLPPDVAASLATWYATFANQLPFGHGEFAHAASASDLRDLWRGTLRHALTDASGQIREQYLGAADSYPWA